MGLVIDPVCGMVFDEDLAVARSVYRERTYYFCHPVCQRIFDVRPARFVDSRTIRLFRPRADNQTANPSRTTLNLMDVLTSSVRSAKSQMRN